MSDLATTMGPLAALRLGNAGYWGVALTGSVAIGGSPMGISSGVGATRSSLTLVACGIQTSYARTSV